MIGYIYMYINKYKKEEDDRSRASA